MAQSLEPVFADLRGRMVRASTGMDIALDQPGNLLLKAPWNKPGKKERAWFGAVYLKKSYVSVHLVPLYSFPSLHGTVPVELHRRMQGVSCFNFKTVEPDLFDALERLIGTCAAAYATQVAAKPH